MRLQREQLEPTWVGYRWVIRIREPFEYSDFDDDGYEHRYSMIENRYLSAERIEEADGGMGWVWKELLEGDVMTFSKREAEQFIKDNPRLPDDADVVNVLKMCRPRP